MANRIANSILNRLAYAAANPDVRHMMDIEDEILGELEDLDTTIAKQKVKLEQKDTYPIKLQDHPSLFHRTIYHSEIQVNRVKDALFH